MRRSLAPAILAAALLATLVPAPASAGIPKAITWKVDHAARTVTISVRITLYPACSDPSCEVLPMDAEAVRAQILRVWNRGYHYKCYRVVVEVDVQVDNSATRGTDPPDRVMIRFDQKAGVDFRSRVSSVGAGPWDSDSPSDKVVPNNDWFFPSTWSGTPTTPFTYAHEFGHVIGLDDTYVDEVVDGKRVSERVPGAPVDVMSGGDLADVEQATIDRLMKRSGEVKDSDLQCDIKIDTTIQGFTYAGTKCDPPTGAWKLAVTGAQPGMTWEGTVTAHLDTGLTGPYAMALTWKVPNLGVGGDRFKGTASFDPGTAVSSASGPSPELRLGPFSGEVWIAGAGVSVGSGGFTLPATYGDFC